MQTIFQPRTRRASGFALIMIMILVAVMLTVFASMMYWVSSNSKITLRNNAYTSAEAAAESGTETVLAPMIRDYTAGGLNSASIYTNLVDQTGWPISYSFPSNYLYINKLYETNLSYLSAEFGNLMGYVDYVTNQVTATASSGPVSVPATVQQTLEFASIPIFQYAIFYNMDLEICPGAAMTISGHVHSNDNIYYTGNSSSQPLTFSTQVDASGFTTNSRSPNDSQTWSPGNVIFSMAGQPVHGADSLNMPVGTNNNPAAVVGIIQLPPSNLIAQNPLNAAAYSPTGSVYLYNAADLIITNSATSWTNFTVLYDNQYVTPPLTVVQPDVQVYITNTLNHNSSTNYFYSFVTNATFYDYRESDTVQAIQIDVGKFNAWLTNNTAIVTHTGTTTITTTTIGGTNRGGYQYNQLNTTSSSSKGHNINSIYVYNSVTPSSSVLPAVRLVNGSQLPSTAYFGNGLISGLTVATAQPIYTMGNYNVTNAGATAFTLGSTTNGGAVPAALIGDALTILSQSWQDSWNSSTALSSRIPVQTTVNAAALEGIVPSGNSHYSGGVENFLRMLENWSNGINLVYNGSIVVMFPSQYATNYWIGPGTYYNPPNRQWGFDLNFTKGQSSQPPMSPQAKYVIRSTFSSW
jgi:hypothetical protein